MRRAVRTVNCSCFYGDRAAAALEVVVGPIDIPLHLLARIVQALLGPAGSAAGRILGVGGKSGF